MRRDIKGIWIPIEVWEHPGLTLFQKVLLAEIDSYDCGEGCYASNSYLAEKLDSTAESIQSIISQLKKKGFLVLLSTKGKKRFLRTSFSRHGDTIITIMPNHNHDYGSTIYDSKSKQKRASRRRADAVLDFEFPKGTDNSPEMNLLKHFIKRGKSKRIFAGQSEFTDRKMKDWLTPIRRLIREEDLDVIQEVMDWHFDNWDRKYRHNIHSAETFAQKFSSLLSAMDADAEDDIEPKVERRVLPNGEIEYV